MCVVPVNVHLLRANAIPAASYQIWSTECNKRDGWRLEQKSSCRMAWRKQEESEGYTTDIEEEVPQTVISR